MNIVTLLIVLMVGVSACSSHNRSIAKGSFILSDDWNGKVKKGRSTASSSSSLSCPDLRGSFRCEGYPDGEGFTNINISRTGHGRITGISYDKNGTPTGKGYSEYRYKIVFTGEGESNNVVAETEMFIYEWANKRVTEGDSGVSVVCENDTLEQYFHHGSKNINARIIYSMSDNKDLVVKELYADYDEGTSSRHIHTCPRI